VPTTISNPASFSSVRTAFNTEGYGISTSFFAYRQGGGIVPATSGFNAIGAGTGGDPLQLTQFNGFTVPSSVVFTPDGGPSSIDPEYLSQDVSNEVAEISIFCSQSATWNYVEDVDSRLGNPAASVSVANGASATDITFTLEKNDTGTSQRVYELSGTSGGVTRYWNIFLRVERD
jgi:hypothetical protein